MVKLFGIFRKEILYNGLYLGQKFLRTSFLKVYVHIFVYYSISQSILCAQKIQSV